MADSSLAFLFPGQGAQTPAFLRALPSHALVDATLDQASSTLDEDVRAWGDADGEVPAGKLQPALLIAGVACARALIDEGCAPQFVAGLSVGTFAAAVVAEALAFEDALRLVELRGRLMISAFPHGFGLAAILGLSESRIRSVLARPEVSSRAYLAAINAPTEIVIAGSDTALAAAIDRARALGASHARRLDVAVPSHCELLAPIAEKLTRAVAEIRIRPPRIEYVGNRRARVLRTEEHVRDELATNLAWPILWHDAMTLMRELGAGKFIEMQPGEVLTTLLRANFPDAIGIALSQTTPAMACALAVINDGGLDP